MEDRILTEPSGAGGLAHSVRTPVHIIQGNVELLLRGDATRLSPDGRRCLREIAEAARILDVAIVRLLSLLDADVATGVRSSEHS